jgi:predicted transcriptional regulator
MLRQTEKQTEIMKVILEAMDKGEELTTRMLMTRLSWSFKWKQAVVQQLQVLERSGFVAKEYRGCRSMLIKPTSLAYSVFRPQPDVLD